MFVVATVCIKCIAPWIDDLFDEGVQQELGFPLAVVTANEPNKHSHYRPHMNEVHFSYLY